MRSSFLACRGIPLCLTLTVALVALLPGGWGCNGSDDPPASPAGEQPAGTVVAASECGGYSAETRTFEVANSQDCIAYDYDGSGTLALRHVNAGLNCCPGEITVPIAIAGNVITLDERDHENGCHCICLFDIDLEIKDLSPGIYLLRVLEPLVVPGDAPLEFELYLPGPTSGQFCVPRTHEPWGLGSAAAPSPA